jgi:hypothetical protein
MSTNTNTDTNTSSSATTDGLGADGGEFEFAPDSAGPFDCRYCGRRFAREEWLALHRGLDHEGRELTTEERAAFEAAREAEDYELRLFRLKALAALVVLYFGFVMAYAVFG